MDYREYPGEQGLVDCHLLVFVLRCCFSLMNKMAFSLAVLQSTVNGRTWHLSFRLDNDGLSALKWETVDKT